MYGGRYLDTYAKQGEEWRISSRRYIMDWTLPLPMLDLRASGHLDYRPF